MSDKAKLRDQQARGAQAERILNDRLVEGAFTAIQQTVEDGWKNSGGDQQVLMNAYLLHRLLGNLREHFEQHIRTGKHAGKELLALEKQSETKDK